MISGKFHCHFTLSNNSVTIPKKYKQTTIFLYNNDISKYDNMITKYYVGNYDDVFNLVLKDIDELKLKNIEVIRFKIEYDEYKNLNRDLELNDKLYLESHIRVACKIRDYEYFIGDLNIIAKNNSLNYYLSNNPNQKIENKIHQFINIRYKQNNLNDGLNYVNKVIFTLQQNKVEIIETRIELNVYDSNKNHDDWWSSTNK